MLNDMLGVLYAAAVVGLVCVLLVVGLACLNVAFFDNVQVVVMVDGRIVYYGVSACVNVSSTGATTRVDVKRGLGCLLPAAYYVSGNVELLGDKR